MKPIFTSLILAFLLTFVTGFVYAQPANDDCSAAIAISTVPYGATCTVGISAVTTGATQSSIATSCAPTSSNDDIWYSFTATATTQYLRYSNFARTSGTAGTQIGYTLYSGTCAAPTEVDCVLSFGTAGSGVAVLSALTPGTTYLLRLFASSASNSATFDFCVQDPPPPPANDDCAGAINIITQPYGATCTSNIAGNTTGATQTTTAPSCTSTANNDDIWYTFTATSTTQYIRYSGMAATIGTATQLAYALYSGACGATQISCVTSFGTAGAGSAYLPGLTIGDVYTLRLWTTGTDNAATFNFCVQDAPSAPANDNCANAISLTQNAACANTAGTTVGATESAAAAPCTGTSDDDVWYSFQANGTDAQIVLSGVTAVIGTSTTLYYQVLSGSCAALTSMMCNTSVTGIVGGLTPGETYYIRVYTSLATSMVNFNICVNDLAAAPTTCPTLSAPAAGAIMGGFPTITWGTSTNASSYELYLDTNPTPTTLYATTYNNSATSFTVTTPLTPGVYYWYVLPVNSVGQPASCATIRSFTVVAAPANDECSSATILVASPNATCTNTAGTTAGATQSNETATTCSNTGTGDDVWYSFVAVSPIHSVALSGTTTTSAVSIYSGTCGSLVLLDCGTANAFAGGLTIGATYYVRVYTTSTAYATNTTFNICITSPPLNDECAGSLPIPLTTYGATCTYTPVNTTGATQSTETGQANTCTGTGIDDDIWYSFTSTFAGSYTFSYTGLTATSGTASTVGMNIYTGSCGNLTEVGSACSSGFGSGGTGSRTVVLAAGTVYTLRLYVGSSPNTGTFNFCITAPPAPAVNDECAGAIALPAPLPTATCVTPTTGTTVGGTQSVTAAPSCSATGINDDVWYSFVANATTHTVLITNATNTTAAAIYSGTCGVLSEIANSCNTGGASAAGLVIGTTYFVRVYSTSATTLTYSDFNICMVSGAPVNDACSGAIALPTPSSTTSCTNSVTGSTLGASPSPESAPSCSPTGTNDDVWYTFVATSSAHTVLISNATNTTAAAVYTGSCGTMTQVASACGSGTGSALATGLTAGNTYYVRVYTTSAIVGTYSNFDICVLSAPANDNCSGAQALTVSTSNSCSAATSGSTLGATATTGEATSSCSVSGIADDVWYSFIATATTHTVSLGDPSTTTAATVYSGSCGGLTQVTCASTNTIATGLTIGNTYYVRVYSTSTAIGTYSIFNICIGVLPSNDNCANAISLTASSGINCNAVAGSTLGATATAGETAPTCSATGINDDVWYSFTATATSHYVSILNATNTTAAAVYSGACGSLVQVSCASTTTAATGLTIGSVYYVRVYTTVSTATTYSNFDICVTGPPTNNECADAATLAGGVTVTGSTTGATQSLAPEACGTATASSAVDVWYKFTATQNGSALLTVFNVATALDAVVQVYSGACGAFTVIGCADGPAGGGTESVSLNGLVAGQTYYARVYGYTSATGTFSIILSGGAVPITLEYFNGNRQNNGNLLQWKVNCTNTASATMVLERSTNQVNFEPVHSITAPAARCLQPFSYVDGRPLAGINYYRLKSVDSDGKVTYSSIIAILNKARGLEIVSLLPNPVNSNAIVNVSSATASKMQFIVTDVAGRQLQTRSVSLIAGSNQVPMNFDNLASGVYYLTGASEDGEKKTIRFVKQ